jgi:hypothetical protein
MSAIGTLICGSSSLGIKNELYTPMIINATINKMVSFELMKKLAIFPDIPSCIFFRLNVYEFKSLKDYA